MPYSDAPFHVSEDLDYGSVMTTRRWVVNSKGRPVAWLCAGKTREDAEVMAKAPELEAALSNLASEARQVAEVLRDLGAEGDAGMLMQEVRSGERLLDGKGYDDRLVAAAREVVAWFEATGESQNCEAYVDLRNALPSD